MLATPTAPTSRATAPRPRNRPLSALLASAWATRAEEGWLTLTSLGFSGLAVAARRLSTALTWSVLGAEVDGGGVAVEAQVGLCRGVADQDGGVDGGGEHGGFEDAGDVEPLAADPDPLAGVDAVDAEPLGGDGAEHGDGFLGGGGVEVVALGDGGGDDREEVEAGGLDGQGVGVDRGDVGAAVGVGAADRPGALHLLHTADTADHGRRRGGQLGGAAGEALAVADGEQVGAELVDLGQQAGLGGGGQAEHGDDGGHADGDAESGQPGPQLPGAQSDGGEPGQVGQLQPSPAQGAVAVTTAPR